ncbi:MAG TPA: MFS transporter [Myxococcota bacterium]|nr:MFS transporter [Myxococcota bacterium]
MIVACALFMENMDATVIATALPTIARSFGESPLRLNLAITCYLLSLGIFLPLSGWLADRFGARTVFSSAIVVFTLGSIGCSTVGSLPQLVLARVVQGIGGAMMVPVGRLVVLRTIPKSELVAAMAYLTVPALIGPVIGPPLGGFIVTYFSWRWIFWINIPIGVLGILLSMRFVPNVRETREEPLDGLGFLVVSLGLAGTMFGFENVGRGILSNGVVGALMGGGIGFLLLYAWHAGRVPAPIVDVALLRVRTFRASVLGGFIFRIGIGALPFLTPLMLQLGFGLSPFASGMITFSGAAGAIFMKITAPAILRALGFRRVLLLNTMVCAVSIACYGFFRPSTPHAVIIGILLVGGFFRSLQFTSLNTLAYADIDQPRMSRATTLSSVGQQLSLSFGVGMGALLLHATLAWKGHEDLGAGDFSFAYFAIAAISVTSLSFFARLPADAGAEISGKKEEPPEVVTSAPATHPVE